MDCLYIIDLNAGVSAFSVRCSVKYPAFTVSETVHALASDFIENSVDLSLQIGVRRVTGSVVSVTAVLV